MTPEQHEAVTTALFAYWTARSDAAAAQKAKGNLDVGGRAGVTAGSHMDRVAQLLGLVAMDAGAPADAVYYQAPQDDPMKRSKITTRCTLPGYYRPTKEWDVVVYDPLDRPCVAIELKSQNGPSYGNNANNRAEEALGNAIDLKRAVEQGLVPGHPWVGYAYVIEDDLLSRSVGGRSESSAFFRDPIFTDWTYRDRVRLLARRLVEDGHYDSAWGVATSRPDCPGPQRASDGRPRCPVIRQQERLDKEAARRKQAPPERLPHDHVFDWTELEASSGFVQFTAAMAERIRSHYPRSPGVPDQARSAPPGR